MAGSDPIAISVDISGFRREISEADRLTRGFGRALGDALEGGVVKGRSLSDTLRGLAGRLSQIALSAALRPFENALGGLFSGLTKGLLGGITPFAKGGVLGAPTVLSSGGAALALAGEAGPEAVLPLARGADGRLGVTAGGGGGCERHRQHSDRGRRELSQVRGPGRGGAGAGGLARATGTLEP